MSARTRSRSAGLTLFGETLLTGVLIALLAAPLVTALPALAAGTARLRRHLAGEPESVRRLLRDFGAACRQLWPLALGAMGLLLLLVWNLSQAQAGQLPGSELMLAVTSGLLAGWAVLLLRLAAGWSEQWYLALLSVRGTARPATDGPQCQAGVSHGALGGTDRAALLRSAARRTVQDPGGSGLLLLALAMGGLLGWMLLPLLLVVGGLLALAVVAVESRQRTG